MNNFESYFSSHTLLKGRNYFNENRVLDHSIDAEGDVVGLVAGSSDFAYETRIFFNVSRTKISDTDCTCPVGRKCKHAAALLLCVIRADRGDATGDLPANRSKNDAFSVPGVEIPKPAAGKRVALAPVHDALERSLKSIAEMRRSARNGNSNQIDLRNQARLIYLLQDSSSELEPVIEPCLATLKKDGSLRLFRNHSIDRALQQPTLPPYVTKEDVEISRVWSSICIRESYLYYSRPNSIPCDVDASLLETLIVRLLNTERCFLDGALKRPLSAGPQVKGSLGWQRLGDDSWRIVVLAGEKERALLCLRWLRPWYVDTENGACGPVRLDVDDRVLESLLRLRPLSNEEALRLPSLLHSTGLLDLIPPPPCAGNLVTNRVRVLPRFEVKTIPVTRNLCIDNEEIAVKGNTLLAAVVTSDKPPVLREPFVNDAGRLQIEILDSDHVGEQIASLDELGLVEVAPEMLNESRDERRYFIAKTPAVWGMLDHSRIESMKGEGWQIPAATEAILEPIELEVEDLHFEGDAEGWWFSLGLTLLVDGKRIRLLPPLIAAIRSLKRSESMRDSIDRLNNNGRCILTLENGTIVSLPFEKLRYVLTLIQELLERKRNVEKIWVADLDCLPDETLSQMRWIGFERIKRFVERLRALQSIEPSVPPVFLRTELRPYQLQGLAWLQMIARFEFGGILADDMGLGKTVQVLAHLCLEKENERLDLPLLVVCPTSVLPNWLSEARRFAPHLKVVSFHGPDRYARLDAIEDADLVVTSYALLARDSGRLNKIKWHGVVLDEAQYIKNHRTAVAKAARSLSARHRICLSGTPVQNNLGELWSLFQFIMPGFLGDYDWFSDAFKEPIEKEGNEIVRTLLAKRVKPFLVRRTKSEVAAELPEKVVAITEVELEGAQRELYETLRLAMTDRIREEVSRKGFKQSQVVILEALLRLRQACCHPQLVKLSAATNVRDSAKLDTLIDMLHQMNANGQKILLFSQFKSMLVKIASRLDAEGLDYVKLTGDTKDRVTPVRLFQQGEVPIFLISLKAGGTGLNLTAADVVIHYDPWWNPAVEDQATDRAHRIGQTKKVMVYKMIASGTIEERMITLQEKKRAIANAVYDDAGNAGNAFTEEDLDLLLAPLGA